MAGLIRRITVENYMAHARSVMEPAAGLTVLVGPNNCGKSAIVHALETLCYNRPADFAVRHGEREAAVTVETDDGHTLVWRRQRGKVSYVIDGQEIHRLKRDVPDDLHTFLKMPLIVPSAGGGDPFCVHFGLQKSPIFLLDDSASRAATFFASSSDAEKLLEMQRLHKEKIRDAQRDATRLDDEIAHHDARLEALQPADALAAEVTKLEASYQGILAEEKTQEAGWRQVDAIAAGDRRVAWLAEHVNVMTALQPPPTPVDTSPLDRLIGAIETTARDCDRDEAMQRAIASISAPPEVLDVQPAERLLAELQSAQRRARRAEDQVGALDVLRDAPIPQEVKPLETSIHHLELAAAKLQTMELAAKILERDLAAVTEQVRRWAEENPHCPLCGGETSVDSVLAGAHAHG